MARTIRIDDDIWEYLELHGKFGDTPSDALRRVIPGLVQKAVPRQVLRPANGAKGVLMADRDYTSLPISGYGFEGKHYPARTYKDVLLGICDRLRETHGTHFDDLALTLHGKKRSYFSRSEDDLKHPRQIASSRVSNELLFVESNMNATSIVGLCQYLIRKLGHNSASFKVT